MVYFQQPLQEERYDIIIFINFDIKSYHEQTRRFLLGTLDTLHIQINIPGEINPKHRL